MSFSLRLIRNISSKTLTTRFVSSATYTADSFERILADTASVAISISLPLYPVEGDRIQIIDVSGNASTNNITVQGNGNDINQNLPSTVINSDNGHADFVFFKDKGWINYTKWIVDRLEALENYLAVFDPDSAADELYLHENFGGL